MRKENMITDIVVVILGFGIWFILMLPVALILYLILGVVVNILATISKLTDKGVKDEFRI